MGITSWNKHIFVCGGYNGIETLDYVEKYSTESDAWSFVSPMKFKRGSFTITALGIYLYAIGGVNKGTIVKTVRTVHI